MNKKDFNESIKLTFIILFGASLFWFLFACQMIWAYDPGGPPLDLKKNSRVNDTLLIQPGTGTSGGSDTARFRTYYGTQACVGVGGNGYLLSGTLAGLPYLDYLYVDGSSTINFSGFTHVAVGGSDIPSASSVTGKINAVGGTGTNNTLNSAQLAGSTTIGAGSTITTGTSTFSGTKIGFLADVESPIGADIANKLTRVGTPTTYLNSVTADGKTGTTSFELYAGTNIAIASTVAQDGKLHATITASGSISATFAGLIGQPTDNAYFKVGTDSSTVPVRDTSGNLFVSGVVGGTTTGALKIPSGTTEQRPESATVGMIRYNTTLSRMEIYKDSFVVTGGTVTTTGTYTVHTFTESGSLNISSTQSWASISSVGGDLPVLEILIVGGGGGSGLGGGGGGGMRYYNNTLSGTYTVTVGAGGAAQTQGNTTSIGTMTVSGGGAGSHDTAGGNGGSGGGGSGNNNAGGTGVVGEGNNGGNSYTASPWPSGGGGGKGAVGANATSSVSGDGGAGEQRNISGSNVYYAGGGGGGADADGTDPGAGGLGGGGAGSTGNGTNGEPNTGGGAGGKSRVGTPTGGIGGSGIVIIRYPTP